MADSPPPVNRLTKYLFGRGRSKTAGARPEPAATLTPSYDAPKMGDMLRRKSLHSTDAKEIKQMMVRSAFFDQLNFVTAVMTNPDMTEADAMKVKRMLKKTDAFDSLRKRLSEKEKLTPRWRQGPMAASSLLEEDASERHKEPLRSSAGRKKSVVVFNYTAKEDDEVSIQRGDVVEVVDTQEDGWYRVHRLSSGETGLVPGNYLGEYTRPATEEITRNSQRKKLGEGCNGGAGKIASLLNKKTLSAQEANEIRQMMTLLSEKNKVGEVVTDVSTNAGANAVSTDVTSVGAVRVSFSENVSALDALFEPGNQRSCKRYAHSPASKDVDGRKSRQSSSPTMLENGKEYEYDRVKAETQAWERRGDDFARLQLDFYDAERSEGFGMWGPCEMVLEENMKVLFVNHINDDTVFTITISSETEISPTEYPEPANAPVELLSTRSRNTAKPFCFKIRESATNSYIFSTHKMSICDSLMAKINSVIDREVETSLDGLIIFGDSLSSTRKKSMTLENASNFSNQVMAKAKRFFPLSHRLRLLASKRKTGPADSRQDDVYTKGQEILQDADALIDFSSSVTAANEDDPFVYDSLHAVEHLQDEDWMNIPPPANSPPLPAPFSSGIASTVGQSERVGVDRRTSLTARMSDFSAFNDVEDFLTGDSKVRVHQNHNTK